MTEISKFVDSIHKILNIEFGYTYYFVKDKQGDNYSWYFDFDTDKYVCPSCLTITVKNDECYDLSYTSVLYHFSPSGTHSLTSKHYNTKLKVKNLNKFKYENLYKWAESQKSTFNNYTQVLKMKNIEQRIKELNKDFK